MISGLIFSSVALCFMMYISIYRKTMFYSFATFLLAISVAALYFQVGWEGEAFITAVMMTIAGYSLWQVTQMRR